MMHRQIHIGESVRCILGLGVFAFSSLACAQASNPVNAAVSESQRFSASWWARTGAEERSGFLNGVADCMTWTAHKRSFNGTPEQLMEGITKYYRSHPEAPSPSVIDVWQKIEGPAQASTASEEHGETWKNAHWYLNGDWWGQISEAQQLGFVEGYLWCLKTQVPGLTDRYSGTPNAYRRRIDAFVKAHPKLGGEAVAITLRRFRDQDSVTPPQ